MPLTFRLDTSNLIRAAQARGQQFAQRVNVVLTRGFAAAGKEYAEFITRRYDRYAAGGGDWAPLQPETIERKKTRRKLIESGGLRRSMNIGGGHNIFAASQRGVSYGSRHPLGSFHQNGTPTIPARPILVPPTRAVQDRMYRAVRGPVDQLFAELGFQAPR